jgi:hypothetical protein
MRRLPRPAYIALVVIAVYSTVGALALVRDRGDDFRRFYASAAAWGHGGNPYTIVIDDTPNLNHPILLPVLWVFTLVSERLGFVAWSVCALAFLVACVPAIGRHARLAPLDVVVVILAATGTSLALGFGQVSLFLMPLFTAAWCTDRAGRTVEAAVLLGALTVLKPFFGLFALYFLWRQQWRALLAYGGVFVAGTLAGWAIVGTSGFLEWLTRLQEVRWRWHIYNASAWGVGDRLFTIQPFFRATGWTPLTESLLLARATTGVLLLVLSWMMVRALSKIDVDRSYAVLGLGALLLSPLGWLYYLPAVLGPVIVVLARRPSRWLWPIAAIAVCPYALLVSRSYGKLGTLLVGQWAFATMVGLLLLIAEAPEQKALIDPVRA